MSHSGNWTGRMRMAWSAATFAASMIMYDGILLWMGKTTTTHFTASAVAIIMSVLGFVIGGKVAHDVKVKKDNTS